MLQELAHGLEELLAYEGDVEEDFGLTFQVFLYFGLFLVELSHFPCIPGVDGKWWNGKGGPKRTIVGKCRTEKCRTTAAE